MGCELNNCQFYTAVRDIANEPTVYGQSVHSLDQIEKAQEIRAMSSVCLADVPHDVPRCPVIAAAQVVTALSVER
jgi:cyclophilin family peptidyl-prolyl cis-trans isomerase